VAQNVFDRVMNFCKNEIRSNTVCESLIECLPRYDPDGLLNFINSHLTGEDKDIKEAIQNGDQNFWESVKKEYEKLWTEQIARELSDHLGDELKMLKETINDADELGDACKFKLLKAYDEVLYKFGDAIKQALQNGKPLSEYDLHGWHMKIGDIVFGSRNHSYYVEIGYLESLYGKLYDNEKSEVLRILLDDIAYVMRVIEEKYLPKLKALTNNNV